jgi:signal transduction histidine kinase
VTHDAANDTIRSTPGTSPEDATALLIGAVQRLSLARTVGEVQEIVRVTARALCGADGATFVLRDGTRCYYADEDAISPLWKGQRFPLDVCVSGWTMRNRSAVVIEDIFVDERVPQEAYRPTFVRSLAMVPIRQTDPIGAIGNYWSDHHRADPHEVQLLQALADATAVALENVGLWAEMEQRVAERTADLSAAVALSDQVLGTLAHELRNAVGGTRGLLDAILHDPAEDLSAALRDDLRLAHDGARDAMQIVEQQLAQAKARASDLRPAVAPIDVRALLADLERTYRALRRNDAVRLVLDAPSEPLTLTSDRHLVTQILRNLISNALKFTDHGEVRFGARRGPGKDEITFIVADTGVGIAPHDQARIFEAFQQVDGEQAGRPTGTGLGLPFVQRVTTLLSGRIELQSAVGDGSTFGVVLPAAPTRA